MSSRPMRALARSRLAAMPQADGARRMPLHHALIQHPMGAPSPAPAALPLLPNRTPRTRFGGEQDHLARRGVSLRHRRRAHRRAVSRLAGAAPPPGGLVKVQISGPSVCDGVLLALHGVDLSTLIVVHALSAASWIADGVVLLNGGVVQACGAPTAVLCSADVEAVFGVQAERRSCPDERQAVVPNRRPPWAGATLFADRFMDGANTRHEAAGSSPFHF